MSITKQNESPTREPAPDRIIDVPSQPERTTKQAVMLELIRRDNGAALDDLTTETGWLPHTVRAAITGLRKRGHEVSRQRIDGVSRYMLELNDE